MKTFTFLLALLLSSVSHASLLDCKDVYVGRIWVEKGAGLKGVVYLSHPSNSSGSYWSYFTGWTPEEKKKRYHY